MEIGYFYLLMYIYVFARSSLDHKMILAIHKYVNGYKSFKSESFKYSRFYEKWASIVKIDFQFDGTWNVVTLKALTQLHKIFTNIFQCKQQSERERERIF